MRRGWHLKKYSIWILLLTAWTVGCSSYTQNTSSNTSTLADFSLQATPTSASLAAGASGQSVTVTAAAVSGFTGNVSVSLSGAPSGVTVSPSTLMLVLGTPQQVMVTASSGAAVGSATIIFTGSSGARTHTASVALTITAAAPPTPPTPPATGSGDITTYHVDVAR